MIKEFLQQLLVYRQDQTTLDETAEDFVPSELRSDEDVFTEVAFKRGQGDRIIGTFTIMRDTDAGSEIERREEFEVIVKPLGQAESGTGE